MSIFRTSLLALFFLLGTFACQQSKEDKTTEDENKEQAENEEENSENKNTEETNEEEIEVKSTRGQIVSLGEADDNEMLTIKIDHEEIPDFMKAMRMDFKAAKADVAELKDGDKISFEMIKLEEGGFKMQNIEKLPEDTELTLKEAK